MTRRHDTFAAAVMYPAVRGHLLPNQHAGETWLVDIRQLPYCGSGLIQGARRSSSDGARHRAFTEAPEIFQNLVAPLRRICDLNGKALGDFPVPARIDFAGE